MTYDHGNRCENLSLSVQALGMTTTLSTTTELRYSALRKRGQQNFVVFLVSLTTTNKVESHRPVTTSFGRYKYTVFKRFLKLFTFFYLHKSRYPSFFLLTRDVDLKFE